jgi:hypothetical protein
MLPGSSARVKVEFRAKRWLRGGEYRGHATVDKVCEHVLVTTFTVGGERYAVPLVEDLSCPEGRGARVDCWRMCEAEFSRLFVEELVSGKCPGLSLDIVGELGGPAEFLRVLGEDATNPHALFRLGGSRVVVKGYRLLREWNPEPSFLKYLSGRGVSPKLHAVYRLGDHPLGVIVEFVEGVDPGSIVYSDALSHIKGEGAGSARGVLDLTSKTLADFHRLMMGCRESWCAPSVVAEADVERWVDRMRFYLGNLPLAPKVAEHLGGLVKRSRERLEAYVGHSKLRTHQDFHFSQTLLSRNNSLVIVDFEGEPARPSWCASELEPGLRDLATLLRAVSYISFFALREATGWSPEETVAALPRKEKPVQAAAEWGLEAAEALVESYLRSVPRNVCPLTSIDDALELLAPWFLERALYEAYYEREYRPQLMQVALATLLAGLPPLQH